MGQLGPPKPAFLVWIKNYFTNNFYLDQSTPMPNFRIIWSFFNQDPLSPFLSLDLKKPISPIIFIQVMIPTCQISKQSSNFLLIQDFPKICQLGPPKPPYFSLDQKTYFTNIFYLSQGTPMPNFRFFNLILVDLIRPSHDRK